MWIANPMCTIYNWAISAGTHLLSAMHPPSWIPQVMVLMVLIAMGAVPV